MNKSQYEHVQTLEQLNRELATIKNNCSQAQLQELSNLKQSLKYRQDIFETLNSGHEKYAFYKTEWHKAYDKLVEIEAQLGLVEPARAYCKNQANKMRKYSVAFMLFLSLFTPSQASQYTTGYVKSNGTRVNSYHRSYRDSNPLNNYSTKGNSNLYTGKVGTVNHYKPCRLNARSYKKY